MNNNYNSIKDIHSNKLHIILLSLLTGLFAGTVVVLYRLVLTYAEEISFTIYDFLRDNLKFIPIWIITLIIFGIIIGKLISKNSMTSGSGIPQVKGIIMGYFENSWLGTLIIKFIGGTLSILGGLSLGREGPSIQLGACVAEGLGKKFSKTRMERKILIASGASAGLAAAFNAPLAGVVFALEEIFKYFSPLILLSTMTSAIVADFVSKQFFGLSSIFQFNVKEAIPLNMYYLLILLGIILGLAGAFYNTVILKVQSLYKKINFIPKSTIPVIPLMFAVLLGLLFPVVLGGGHKIIHELNLSTGLYMLIAILVVKFIFSIISFGSGAPGGIFFPLLIIGGTIGAIFATICINYLGCDPSLFYNFVIISMAGYFTAIVRAPITGIVLITEMTGSFHHLLSLGVVSIIAYIIADLVKSVPIYDSLLENQLKSKKLFFNEVESSKKVMIDMVVQYGSQVANKKVKDVEWPKRTLLISIKRMEQEILPKGDTEIKEGDYLIVITDTNNEYTAREGLLEITSVD